MRKHLLFTYLYIQTFLHRHIKQLVLAGIFGFFATLLIIEIYPYYENVLTNKTVRIGKVGSYSQSTLPNDLLTLISTGLTTLAANGEATASLAQSWEIDQNGTNYTFYLKPGLLWHDGKRLVAEDISYKIKGTVVKPINDLTLTLQLKESYAPLPVILSQPILRNGYIGLGNYKIIKLVQASGNIKELVLKPQDNSYPTYVYKFYQSVADIILAFKLGEIDKIQDLPQLYDLPSWKNISIHEITLYDRVVALFFNLKDSRFRDKEVRQALAYALPKIENVEKAVSPISPLSWAYSKKIRLYNYDPNAASKILSKSQLASESAQLTLSTYASLLEYAQIIADAWKEIGIDTKIKVESQVPSDYQIIMMTLAIPPDPDQYPYWQSTQELTNITGYSSPKIDRLLEMGRKEMDTETRRKIYADFQLYLVDDAPALFLFYPKTYNIERIKK